MPERIELQKSASSTSRGSSGETCFETMSPVRYVNWYSPNVSGSRSITPESNTRTGSLLVSS